jgi:hypothetical protein
MKFTLSLILIVLTASTALADDTARNRKIAEIVKAQGVYQQFDDLIQQSKVSTGKFLDESYRKILSDLNAPNARSNPKFEAAFRRFSDKAANLWTADDLLAVWTKNYGRICPTVNWTRFSPITSHPSAGRILPPSRRHWPDCRAR